jgi:hypothetical protein
MGAIGTRIRNSWGGGRASLPHQYLIIITRVTSPDAAQTNAQTGDQTNALVASLQDQVSYLRGQQDAEGQVYSEVRRIIAGLVQRVQEIEPP